MAYTRNVISFGEISEASPPKPSRTNFEKKTFKLCSLLINKLKICKISELGSANKIKHSKYIYITPVYFRVQFSKGHDQERTQFA